MSTNLWFVTHSSWLPPLQGVLIQTLATAATLRWSHVDRFGVCCIATLSFAGTWDTIVVFWSKHFKEKEQFSVNRREGGRAALLLEEEAGNKGFCFFLRGEVTQCLWTSSYLL